MDKDIRVRRQPPKKRTRVPKRSFVKTRKLKKFSEKRTCPPAQPVDIPCLDYSPDSVLQCEGSSTTCFELQNQSISAPLDITSAQHESISASREMETDVFDTELVGLKFASNSDLVNERLSFIQTGENSISNSSPGPCLDGDNHTLQTQHQTLSLADKLSPLKISNTEDVSKTKWLKACVDSVVSITAYPTTVVTMTNNMSIIRRHSKLHLSKNISKDMNEEELVRLADDMAKSEQQIDEMLRSVENNNKMLVGSYTCGERVAHMVVKQEPDNAAYDDRLLARADLNMNKHHSPGTTVLQQSARLLWESEHISSYKREMGSSLGWTKLNDRQRRPYLMRAQHALGDPSCYSTKKYGCTYPEIVENRLRKRPTHKSRDQDGKEEEPVDSTPSERVEAAAEQNVVNMESIGSEDSKNSDCKNDGIKSSSSSKSSDSKNNDSEGGYDKGGAGSDVNAQGFFQPSHSVVPHTFSLGLSLASTSNMASSSIASTSNMAFSSIASTSNMASSSIASTSNMGSSSIASTSNTPDPSPRLKRVRTEQSGGETSEPVPTRITRSDIAEMIRTFSNMPSAVQQSEIDNATGYFRLNPTVCCSNLYSEIKDYSSLVRTEDESNPRGRSREEVVQEAKVTIYKLLLEHCVSMHDGLYIPTDCPNKKLKMDDFLANNPISLSQVGEAIQAVDSNDTRLSEEEVNSPGFQRILNYLKQTESIPSTSDGRQVSANTSSQSQVSANTSSQSQVPTNTSSQSQVPTNTSSQSHVSANTSSQSHVPTNTSSQSHVSANTSSQSHVPTNTTRRSRHSANTRRPAHATRRPAPASRRPRQRTSSAPLTTREYQIPTSSHGGQALAYTSPHATRVNHQSFAHHQTASLQWRQASHQPQPTPQMYNPQSNPQYTAQPVPTVYRSLPSPPPYHATTSLAMHQHAYTQHTTSVYNPQHVQYYHPRTDQQQFIHLAPPVQQYAVAHSAPNQHPPTVRYLHYDDQNAFHYDDHNAQ